MYAQQFRSSRTVSPPLEKLYGYYTPYGGVDAVADFNGDGRPDFVTVSSDPQTSASVMSVMLQNSDGTFHLFDASYLPLAHVVTGDLNGDGRADLVSLVGGDPPSDGFPGDPGSVTVSLGNGDGTFNVIASMSLLGDSRIPSGVVADLNNDNLPDVVAASTDSSSGNTSIQTWLNQGAGAFTAGPVYNHTLLNGAVLTFGDFNQDGRQDLVVSDAGQARILLGNGDGSFRAGAVYSIAPLYAQAADFNNDHHLDLVLVSAKNSRVLLGRGDGTFAVSATLDSSFGASVSHLQFVNPITPTAVHVADLNHDGFLDIAIATESSSQDVSIYYGRGNGAFTNAKVFDIGGNPGYDTPAAAFADFNRDGRLDVIAVDVHSGFNIAYGTSYGEFNAPIISQAPDAGGVQSEGFNGDGQGIVKADLNGDGIEDVAVIDKPFCLSCGGDLVRVFLGTGKGYFSRSNRYRVPMPWGNLAVGDVNGDGKPDLVVARNSQAYNMGEALTYSGPDVSVLLGRGDGTFEDPVNSTVLGPPPVTAFSASAYLVDVNSDGRLDLVGDWGAALGKRNGQFAAPIPLPSGLDLIMSLVPGDFDGTGKIGLAIATNTSDGIGLYTPAYVNLLSGDGRGSFKIRSRISTGILSALTAADVNGDGPGPPVHNLRRKRTSHSLARGPEQGGSDLLQRNPRS